MTLFSDLGLIEPLYRAVAAEGYTSPTPIQDKAIPRLLAGHDVLGIAQTGTGKTAAFALPILQHLVKVNKRPAPKSARAVILTPTRELALQIADGFATYGKFVGIKRTVIHGGVSEKPQIAATANGTDVLIATPGRLLDLMNQRRIDLSSLEIFVLDEADRMLDMGFIRDVQKIVRTLPKERQTLLFSATMPDAVSSLAKSLLRTQHERIEVTPPSTTVERIAQKVMFVSRENKRHLLADLLKDGAISRAIVFTRTKHCANRVAEQLQKGGISADAIHGNKSQNARQRSLSSFKAGETRILVATDIAARGIDVDGVSHVINFEMPVEPESYVHRIGRTARAGNEGIAISFCDREEMSALRAIERSIRQPVPVDEKHAYHAAPGARSTQPEGEREESRGNTNHRGRNHNGPKKPGGGGGRPRRSGGGGGGGRDGGGRDGGRPWENRSRAA